MVLMAYEHSLLMPIRAHFAKVDLPKELYNNHLVIVSKHRWCSGSIAAFQAVDMFSIPVLCISFGVDGI